MVPVATSPTTNAYFRAHCDCNGVREYIDALQHQETHFAPETDVLGVGALELEAGGGLAENRGTHAGRYSIHSLCARYKTTRNGGVVSFVTVCASFVSTNKARCDFSHSKMAGDNLKTFQPRLLTKITQNCATKPIKTITSPLKLFISTNTRCTNA